jgi:hypothetical protein
MASLLLLLGCAQRHSTFDIVDYRSDGEVRRFHETFEEAYYSTGGDGNIDIILRRSEPTSQDAREEITQVIRIRTVWRSLPGKTVAHSTQINGTISYIVLGPNGGTAFEGTGSVFFKENRKQDEIEGSLDIALLRPLRKVDEGQPIFEMAELRGKFRAIRDTRRVVRMKNDTERLLGPLPREFKPSPY